MGVVRRSELAELRRLGFAKVTLGGVEVLREAGRDELARVFEEEIAALLRSEGLRFDRVEAYAAAFTAYCPAVPGECAYHIDFKVFAGDTGAEGIAYGAVREAGPGKVEIVDLAVAMDIDDVEKLLVG